MKYSLTEEALRKLICSFKDKFNSITDDLSNLVSTGINEALKQAKDSGEFDGKDGEDGDNGVGIESIRQTNSATAGGGQNKWLMTMTDGSTFEFVIRNGNNGHDGDDGKSAYEFAKDAGYTGTETEFTKLLNNAVSGNHEHKWKQIVDRPFGMFPTSEGVDTIYSDDTIHNGKYKVSDFTPNADDLAKGGTLSFYRVSECTVTNGVVSGNLNWVDFPSGKYWTTHVADNGLIIFYDGYPMVIFSLDGNPTFGAVTFPTIMEPGTYFCQNEDFVVHSVTINDFDGFKSYEVVPIPEMYLPNITVSSDTHDCVKTVNNIKPDAKGNVNVTVEGGASSDNGAFDLVKSDTLTWNGNEEGRVVIDKYLNSYGVYWTHISSVVPTLAEWQKGGTWSGGGSVTKPFTDDFTSKDVVDRGNVITCLGTEFIVAKDDGVTFDDGYIQLTLPKKGIYVICVPEGTDKYYVNTITINDYTGFTKSILKKDNLPAHSHDWYGKVTHKGNTVLSDDLDHGTYVKVSDAAPTMADLNKGGVLRYRDTPDGELQVKDLSEFSITKGSNGITISIDGFIYACITDDGKSVLASNGLPGTYFSQNQYVIVHSLTINDYEGFEHNLEKVPSELLPDNVGGGSGVTSWDDMPDRPFGETITYGDTITFNQDLTGKEWVLVPNGSSSVMIVHVSDAVPSISDCANGFTVKYSTSEDVNEWTNGVIVDLGVGYIIADVAGVIYEDNIDISSVLGVDTPIILPKKGIYLMYDVSTDTYPELLTIHGYNRIKSVVIDRIDPKFIPFAPTFFVEWEPHGQNYELITPVSEIIHAYNNGAMIYLKSTNVYSPRLIPLREATVLGSRGVFTFEDITTLRAYSQLRCTVYQVGNINLDTYQPIEDTMELVKSTYIALNG